MAGESRRDRPCTSCSAAAWGQDKKASGTPQEDPSLAPFPQITPAEPAGGGPASGSPAGTKDAGGGLPPVPAGLRLRPAIPQHLPLSFPL